MPTYSYRCADCAHAFDIYQEFTDDSLTVCPECDGTLRKVFGNIGVTFSGSGFYRTDSRESKTGDAKKSTDTSTAPSTSTSTGPSKDAGGASSAPAKTEKSSAASSTSGSSSSGGSTAAS